jgi:hypothetical protein
MSLNSTLKRMRGLIRKTRKNIGISGGMIRRKRLSPSAAEFVPSSFMPPAGTPVAPVESREEREVVKALASSMAAPNRAAVNFMSMALNTLNKLNAVAMDCEMVGIRAKKDGEEKDNVSALAHIAIVDVNGNILMNEYVIPKGGLDGVTHWRTDYSGITKETYAAIPSKDRKKHSFGNIKKRALKILKNRIIVGHGLKNDFEALELNMDDFTTWDTATKEEHQRETVRYGKQPRKLKSLAAEIGNVIQVAKEDKKGHSPVEDARASMNLYRHYVLKMDKVPYTNMSK